MLDKTKHFEKLMMHHLSGNISDNDERVLLHILKSDPKFKILYIEMAKTRAISFSPILESEKSSNYQLLIESINNRLSINIQPNYLKYFLRIAAVIIFVLSTSISTYYIFAEFNSSTNNMMSYQTIVPLGSQTKIILPDGTIAWLNSGSILKYDNLYGNKNREVSLIGEGYFEVTKNESKPFLVQTNNIKVKVLGTVFNVRSYSEDPTVEVNLLKGKVDVSLLDKNNTKKIVLLPNMKMVYDKATKNITSYNVDASRSGKWTTGKLCFVDATLDDIAKDLERKYDIQIQIKSQQIKDESFSGSLDLNQPIAKILEYIDVDKKFIRTYNGKIVTITNKN